MTIQDVLYVSGITILATVGFACLSALFSSVRLYYMGKLVHFFNKQGGRTYFIVSGEPQVVDIVYEVCVQTLQKIEAQRQTLSSEEGIKLNEESAQNQEDGTR